MLITSTLYTAKPVERRAFGRISSNIRARLAGNAEHPQQVTVRNVSKGGFMVEDWIGLKPRQLIDIEMPPLTKVRATVAWTIGKQAGCEFCEPLNERQLDVLLNIHAPPVPQMPPVFGRKGTC